MKQYEKVFVPDKDDCFLVKEVGDDDEDALGWFSPKENVIVLTIEELRELWNAAQDRSCALQIGDPDNTKIFETYLQSKGIQIT